MKICLVLFFIYFINVSTQSQSVLSIDSAKKIINSNSVSDSTIITTSFFIADSYMDINQYDSAQIWLNNISKKLPVKSASVSNYFLISRQAEVYYYNNLQQLGLQESKRGLEMAKVLNDSFLLADSYNFLGLFYMNIDSISESIPLFIKGIKFLPNAPALKKYLHLTKPHHLHGNLSEAYFKSEKYENAITSAKTSYTKASQINSLRGMAVAYMSIGNVYISTNKLDSAIYYFESAVVFAENNNDKDIILLANGNLAKCNFKRNNKIKEKTFLQNGFKLLQTNSTINSFYALEFLQIAIEIYDSTNNKEGLNNALNFKSKIESDNLKKNNTQLQTILQASLINEKRLLNFELLDAQQKQKLANSRLIILIVLIFLLGIGFLVYRYYLNQKLALSTVRNKISQDLHDDVGASLSSLQVYSAVASQHLDTNPQKTKELLQKISDQSTLLMDTIGDIVWSMKLGAEQVISFEAKVKNYVTDIFAALQIEYVVDVDSNLDEFIKTSNAKRNILMIVKESVNNVVKYSKATKVTISVKKWDHTILIEIIDNGIGFLFNQKNTYGNGINNIKKRAKELNGEAIIETTKNIGTSIKAIIPLTALSNVGW